MNHMADLSFDTIQRLWRETRGYTWESLREGLDVIYENDVISDSTYDRLQRIIAHLQDLRVRFPRSPNELEDRINFYM